MVDAPGKDTPQTDPKPAASAGPVRPPVLEGTARPTSSTAKPVPGKPETDKRADKPEPPKTKPAVREDDRDGASPWLAGLVGGLIGLGAAYGLAYFGLWPSLPQAAPAADPRLAQIATAVPELQTVTSTVQDELSTLNGRVAELETSVAERPADTAPAPDLTEDLAALSARIDEVAAAPAPEANTEGLDALRAELAALSEQVSSGRAEIQAAQAEIAALTETASAVQDSQGDAARLPLIFSSLESAFAAGRSFSAELDALEAAQPDATVPDSIADRAELGLPRPDDVAQRLQSALPDMLAGRPVAADAGWQDATADWFRGIIAMRPAGAVEGEGPDAVVARLEAAVERRDFVAAEAEFAALPASMQNAAGTLGEDIAALAAASTMLTELRSAALGREANT